MQFVTSVLIYLNFYSNLCTKLTKKFLNEIINWFYKVGLIWRIFFIGLSGMAKGFIWIWVCGSFCLSFCPSFCLEVHLELVHKFFLKHSMILRNWLCVVELDFFLIFRHNWPKIFKNDPKKEILDSLLNCKIRFG